METLAKSSGVFSYLEEQNASVLNKLYGSGAVSTAESSSSSDNMTSDQSSFVAKAVFQSLSALSKNYVIRLLYCETPTTSRELSDWITLSHRKEHDNAIEELLKLRIIQEQIKEVVDPNITEDTLGDSDVMIIDMSSTGINDNSDTTKEGMISSTSVIEMSPYFRQALRRALTTPQEPWQTYITEHKIHTVGITNTIDDGSNYFESSIYPIPTKEELRQLSMQKWDSLLRFIVGLKGAIAVNAGGTIESFVRKTGLMAGGTHSKGTKQGLSQLKITQQGYAYMLKPYQNQVWYYVYQLIQSTYDKKEELLSLLFMISYCEFGKGYPIRALTPAQQVLIMEFSQLGLVYASGGTLTDFGSVYDIQSILSTTDEQWLFYPASIAINMIFRSFSSTTQNLSSHTTVGRDTTMMSSTFESAIGGTYQNMGEFSSSKANLVQSSSNQIDRSEEIRNSITSGLEIIVETNMQIVAYLTSDLHLALLSMFVEFSVQLPNVAIGVITRDKAKEAFKMGIRVSQIVDFLCSHAHKLTKEMKPIIPTNVVDQLVLWESERYRIKHLDSILLKFDHIKGFDCEIFIKIENYAQKLGVCLASNADKFSLVVTYEGYEQLRPFVEDALI